MLRLMMTSYIICIQIFRLRCCVIVGFVYLLLFVATVVNKCVNTERYFHCTLAFSALAAGEWDNNEKEHENMTDRNI